MYYVGLDVGTSSLKSTVMDDNKCIVFESSYNYSFDEPAEGYREIEPNVWFETTKKALSEIFAKYRDEIVTIGVTGQMHSTVFLDKEGNSIRPSIMWNDLRTSYLVPQLKDELSKIEETKYIAKIISPGSPATNLLWLKQNEPDNFNQIYRVMTPYDYIVYKLTGKFSCDYCDASTSSLYDIVKKEWSQYMLNKLELSEECLGKVHNSCDEIGVLSDELQKEYDIKHSISVIAGTGDNPATAVAMGILNSSDPVISLGTSGVVISPKEDGDFEGKGKNVLFNEKGDRFINIVQSTVQSAGGTHRWWVQNIVQSSDFAIDQEDIEIDKLGDNSVLFFPHITGDKTIYQDSTIRGAFFGLSANTTRKDMTQAVFEGVAFGFKDIFENLNLKVKPKKIQINGGGTKSAVWMQILADVLDIDIEVVTKSATPGYGVCLLGYYAKNVNVENSNKVDSTVLFKPNQNASKKYFSSFMKYKKIYNAIREIY